MNYTGFIFRLFMGAIMVFIIGLLLINLKSIESTTIEQPSSSHGILHTDPSARTGFLSNEEYTARFETIDFPVAGESNMNTVCRIDVWKYPSIPGKDPGFEYITDSYEEAVEFLNVLMGK